MSDGDTFVNAEDSENQPKEISAEDREDALLAERRLRKFKGKSGLTKDSTAKTDRNENEILLNALDSIKEKAGECPEALEILRQRGHAVTASVPANIFRKILSNEATK